MHYNKENSYVFVNGTEIHQVKSKDSEIFANSLRLGNISEECSADNMKKKLDLMVMFMILVLIMTQLRFLI